MTKRKDNKKVRSNLSAAKAVHGEAMISDADDVLAYMEGEVAIDEVEAAAWSNFLVQMEAGLVPGPVCVGIFWQVGEHLLTDATSLLQAERYGSFLIHPVGHFELWERWQRFGAKALEAHGLTSAIKHNDYAIFPRGRIVFCWSASKFIVYADQRLLFDEVLIRRILSSFGLDLEQCVLKEDEHYQTNWDMIIT